MQPSMNMRVAEHGAWQAVRMLGIQPRERLLAEKRCRQALADPTPFTDAFKDSILAELKAKRLFEVIPAMAERIIAEGEDSAPTYKAYAQALIENGNIAAARAVLARALAAAHPNSPEWQDILGVTGRARKQLFVQLAASKADKDKQSRELNAAIDCYMLCPFSGNTPSAWQHSPYHAINVVALESRARRDGFTTPAAQVNIEDVATQLLETIEANGASTSWDNAIAAEACVALRRPGDQVLRWVRDYTNFRGVDVFELGSTFRQFTEVWQLAKDDPGYGPAIQRLEAVFFDQQGGAVPACDVSRWVNEPDLVTADWIKKCVSRSRSVGRIKTATNFGSGFLIHGTDLDGNWKYPVFLTNSHVTGADRPQDMTVQFLGTGSTDEWPVAELLYAASPDTWDLAVLRLARLPDGYECAPIRAIPPTDSAMEPVFVMGYPEAGPLSVSLYKNALIKVGDRTLHYTAMTHPGSSGSPIFNNDWEAVGIHHGVGPGFLPDGTPFMAHEGIAMEAIHDQARLEPKSRWPQFEAIHDQGRLEPLRRT